MVLRRLFLRKTKSLRKGTHWPTHPFHLRLVGGGDPPLPPPTSLLPHPGPCDHGTFSPRAASSEVNSSRESEVGVASLLGSDASIKRHLKGNWRKMLSSKMKIITMTKSRAIAEQCSLWLICVFMAILVCLEGILSVLRVSLSFSIAHAGTQVRDGFDEANLEVLELPVALGQELEQRLGTIFEIFATALEGLKLEALVSAQFLVEAATARAPYLILVYAELDSLDGCVG
ncbi:hypothetical protein PG999_007308 [Apiospora kogelbergensis]|uniref:Uncharacterized protein n=1 Tax=Apiospora kogelbergensis TaxID=1337665 RepID=A0AAW0QY19_9PEZI